MTEAVNSADDAHALAAREVIAPSRHDLVLRTDMTQEHDFGWVVFPTTRRFLETGHARDTVPGLGPVVVARTGEVVPLSTSVPPNRAIEIFEEMWRSYTTGSD